jgi:hypothetical protein
MNPKSSQTQLIAMKSLWTVFLVYSHIFTASMSAVTLPVVEDTFSNSRGFLAPSAGKAPTLLVTANQNAFLQFDLSSLPRTFAATNIVSARLRLYIVSARTSGDLTVSTITSQWTESVITNVPMPTFDAAIAGSVSAAGVKSKHFATFDVTAAISAALIGQTNFGFSLRVPAGQVVISSKEGPSQGPAAELEIDANLSQSASGDGSFPGSLGVGGNFDLLGLMRQGSEIGTAEPAGRGIIIRRIQSTNSAAGSIVARTDTVTLERDGTLGGWRIVTAPNAGNVVVSAIAVNANDQVFAKNIVIGPSPYPAATNTLFFDNQYIISLRCSFGSPYDLGHHTEVSIIRTPNQGSPSWVGTLMSSYNQ